jgi:hypothetical protein
MHQIGRVMWRKLIRMAYDTLSKLEWFSFTRYVAHEVQMVGYNAVARMQYSICKYKGNCSLQEISISTKSGARVCGGALKRGIGQCPLR